MATWLQAVTPNSTMPMCIASREAAGTPTRKASMPRRKSRWS